MTREEALKILKECCDKGFNRTTYTYDEYVMARDMAIESLEQEPYVLCINCKNFENSDNYCKLLQINFIPDEFGCNKGEKE